MLINTFTTCTHLTFKTVISAVCYCGRGSHRHVPVAFGVQGHLIFMAKCSLNACGVLDDGLYGVLGAASSPLAANRV